MIDMAKTGVGLIVNVVIVQLGKIGITGVNGRINEWVSEWMNDWMNQWMSEWMNKWTH